MRGRKPVNLPLNLILQLHKQGYSCEMIAHKLNQMGYNVSRWTVWRRLRNFATKSGNIRLDKPGVNTQIDRVVVAKFEVEVYAGEAD